MAIPHVSHSSNSRRRLTPLTYVLRFCADDAHHGLAEELAISAYIQLDTDTYVEPVLSPLPQPLNL